MTPRAVDWGLAALVWALFATGTFALFTGNGEQAWVFGAHAVLAFVLVALLWWKLRRVWSRLTGPWDRTTRVSVVALTFVTLALLSGLVWSSGGDFYVAGYNLLSWHYVLGTALVVFVAAHALLRRKPIRVRDVSGRRQFFVVAGTAIGALAVWQLQRPFDRLVGWRGGDRRFTGSFAVGRPIPTSWVADSPREIAGHPLVVDGLIHEPRSFASLPSTDVVSAVLDCTGGWYAEVEWRGIQVARLIEMCGGALPRAGWLRVESYTGYRWSFPLSEAGRLLLATSMSAEPLTHGHGAPARLVAPGRRGFQWVKWVVRIELTEHEDHGAPASTIWSSSTARGRGDA